MQTHTSAAIVDRRYLDLFPVMRYGELYEEFLALATTPLERRSEYQWALSHVRKLIAKHGAPVLRSIVASDADRVAVMTPVERGELALLLASLRAMASRGEDFERAALALCGRVE